MVKSIYKSFRFIFLAVSVFISLMAITNIIPLNSDVGVGLGNGIDYGLDFAGGTQLQLRLNEPVDENIMAVEKGILENRLNSLGLKDIPVRPWGSQYLLIQVAGASPTETGSIEDILKQQARFEEMIDGALAVKGDEISVDLSAQGRGIQKTTGGYNWYVSVQHNKEGGCRFGKVAEGKKGRPVDLFIDRPVNTAIVFTSLDYTVLSNMTSAPGSEDIFYGDTGIEVIENRSRVPTLPYTGDEVERLSDLTAQGIVNVIIAGDEIEIPDSYRNILEEQGFQTSRMSKGNLSYGGWIQQLIGLRSSPRLNFNTLGECQYRAQITGTSQTLQQAQDELKTNQVLLTSGNLPVGVTLESKSTTAPRLGSRFLKYSVLTGVLALFTVAFILFVRYRQPKIVLPLVGVGLSEVIIILGLAAFINWELDLPAVAGIIAAVGTGVDHLIVITDETLKNEARKNQKKKIVVLTDQIRRAFFIIFTAASTTVAAMLPIMSIGAGMLKGFAFTTIMGVMVGVLIARPTYAKIIQHIMTRESQ